MSLSDNLLNQTVMYASHQGRGIPDSSRDNFQLHVLATPMGLVRSISVWEEPALGATIHRSWCPGILYMDHTLFNVPSTPSTCSGSPHREASNISPRECVEVSTYGYSHHQEPFATANGQSASNLAGFVPNTTVLWFADSNLNRSHVIAPPL